MAELIVGRPSPHFFWVDHSYGLYNGGVSVYSRKGVGRSFDVSLDRVNANVFLTQAAVWG